MPHLLDTPTRAQTICTAVTRLIANGGMAAVTTRAIAAQSGVSIATLAHQFTNRDRLLGVMAGMFGTDLIASTADRSRSEGVFAFFLPASNDDLAAMRVWLAWTELGRSDPESLDCAEALIEGLRAAVCAKEDPMSLERARSALELGLRCLGRGA